MKLQATEISTYLAENRNTIIRDIENLIFRAKTLYTNKSSLTLKDAMNVYKIVLEDRLDTSAAYSAVCDYTSKSGKVERGFFLSESAKRQLPSSMR